MRLLAGAHVVLAACGGTSVSGLTYGHRTSWEAVSADYMDRENYSGVIEAALCESPAQLHAARGDETCVKIILPSCERQHLELGGSPGPTAGHFLAIHTKARVGGPPDVVYPQRGTFEISTCARPAPTISFRVWNHGGHDGLPPEHPGRLVGRFVLEYSGGDRIEGRIDVALRYGGPEDLTP